MGTFHDHLGELHGFTVLVDARDDARQPMAVIGRCHEVNERFVLLHDADRHPGDPHSPERQQWVSQACRWGVFPRHQTLRLPRHQVLSITPLNQVQA